LSIGVSGANALVAWPLFGSGFNLYQSTLAAPIAWVSAPYLYSTNATGISVAAPAKSAREFFRLEP
jgi:hypothetical protein